MQDIKPIHKNSVFLHTSNKVLEKEIRRATPLKTALKKIKYLGINLTVEVKHKYTKTDK